MSAPSELNLTIRRGRPQDSRACNELLWEAATDLGQRSGRPLSGSADDWWASLEPVYEFVARHSAEWWVAESASGEIVGFSRSIERGAIFELTELFVRPGIQSRGLGRELIEKAFPLGRGGVRLIIATTDVRALSRYYAAGTMARFPIFTLTGTARNAQPGELIAEPLSDDRAQLSTVAAIEHAVLGHSRPQDEIESMLGMREGFLYRRDGRAVGFSFVGPSGAGPIAALEPGQQPDILLHVESRAAALGLEPLEFEIPGPNAEALAHLARRGFRIDPWINLLMTSEPFGQFDRYVGFSPPIVL